MLSRLFGPLKQLKRFFRRAVWAPSLLGLKRRTKGEQRKPGLILIQVDGLGYEFFMNGLKKNRLPFLKKLLHNEHYRVRRFYSGMPSTTPAVQGELFYGVHCAVPAFAFQSADDNKLHKMLEWNSSTCIEDRLMNKGGQPLLEGGSSYCNIYEGGADEPHFCAASFGWNSKGNRLKKIQKLMLLLLNIPVILRVAAIALAELFLALYDVITWKHFKREWKYEFKFLPARVMITGFMRELLVFGARVDAVRGLPIIHLNLLGYDEQSHRRGPDSAFADWTLKGIDFALRRIWNEAKDARRNYRVWIYSDHGQEKTVPYEQCTGKSIDEAVDNVLADPRFKPTEERSHALRHSRVRWLGLFNGKNQRSSQLMDRVHLAAQGPVGHLYLNGIIEKKLRSVIAERLVKEANVPMAAVATENGTAAVFTKEGWFSLPEEGEKIFTKGHPFLKEVSEDTAMLVHHKEAGDIVFFGYNRDGDMMTFPVEAGSHCGPGPIETCGFLMAPSCHALFDSRVCRPETLRNAALNVLEGKKQRPQRSVKKNKAIRVMTYNVHSCRGMDGRYSVDRIAHVVERLSPDVVCLQEVDVGRRKSGGEDQVKELAELLGMEAVFQPVWEKNGSAFGNVIVSRLPMRLIKKDILQKPEKKMEIHPRGAVWVELETDLCRLQILNTHLGLTRGERKHQMETLFSSGWLGGAEEGALVVCGDFNTEKRSSEIHRAFARHNFNPAAYRIPTWPANMPFREIDHIFTRGEIRIKKLKIPPAGSLRIASDHLPLTADIMIADG